MRVLHLTTEFPPVIYGGLGTAVGGLVGASMRAGIETAVLLVGAGDGSSYGPIGTIKNGRTAEPAEHRPRGARQVSVSHDDAASVGTRLIRDFEPDVLHLHVFWLWPLARLLRARTGIPLVYTVHSLDRAEYELGQGPPECLSQWETQADLIAAADLVVALTRSERDLIAEYCPATRDRIRVVGNGIEDHAEARAAAERHCTGEEALILFTGRFVERKGVRELLAAVAPVLHRAPRTRFVLAGGHRHCDGETMARYWLPAELAPYRDRVQFTGWLSAEELATWYRRAHVLVVPSWYEPFGMVVLEGMLFGLPIAASAVGGPAEILEHGTTGLLFPPRDATALAGALIQLIEAPRLQQRLGRAAALAVRQRWLYSSVVERMRAIYDEAATPLSRPDTLCMPLAIPDELRV